MPVNRLDSAALERTLRTVGMKTFVDFYKDFPDLQITLTDIKLKLSSCGYSANSISTKASTGRRIINNGQGREALELIIKATRVDEDTRKKAEELLS